MGVYLLIGIVVECARLTLRGSLGKLKGLSSDINYMGWMGIILVSLLEISNVLSWPLAIIGEIIATIKKW